MHRLLIVLLALVSAATFAQENGSARVLLQEVDSAARASKSWRAEGITLSELTIKGTEHRQEVRFKVAAQGPLRMRWETSGDDQTTIVCDGANHWTFYRQSGGGFYHSSIAVSPCGAGINVGDFLKLTDGLVSAIYMGRDQVQFAGALRECLLVRTEYQNSSQTLATGGRTIHILCIDPANRMVLRQQTEGSRAEGATSVRFMETTTYLSYERDVSLPPDTFRFVAPAGVTELKAP